MRFEKAPKLNSFFTKYHFGQMEDRIQTLVFNDKEPLLTAYTGLITSGTTWVNGYLKDWKCYAEINSLAEQPFPNLPEFATDSERLSATLNVEWGSPRFHCCIWSTNRLNPSNIPSDGHWTLEGKFSLYKAFGYPYRIYYPFDLLTNNIAREFGENVRFGFSIENVGYGYPLTTGTNQDIITFSGNWTQEVIVVSPEPLPVIINNNTYTGSNSPSPSPSPSPTPTQSPPTVILTPPSGVTTVSSWDNHVLAILITGLTPSSNFTLSWIKGTSTVIKTNTFQSDSTGKYEANFESGQMSLDPFQGSGSYKIRATQNSVSGDSAVVNVNCMSITFTPTPTTSNPEQSIQAKLYGFPTSGLMYNLRWFKNNVDTGQGSLGFSNATDPPGSYTFSTAIFSQDNSTFGTGAGNLYKLRLMNNNTGAHCFSPTFTVS